MSAFLGPIHYWLYNKIQLQQDLIDEIIGLGEKQYNLNLKKELDTQYGESERRPLEEVIDETNIHGWLQSKVSQVEYKLAYSILLVTQEEANALKQIEELFAENGKKKRAELEEENLSAKELYSEISNKLLDGMPCDHANTVLENSENKVVWKRNTCVHKNYWDAVGMDIKVYYQLRDAWMNGFLSEANETFEKIDEVTYSLKKGA